MRIYVATACGPGISEATIVWVGYEPPENWEEIGIDREQAPAPTHVLIEEWEPHKRHSLGFYPASLKGRWHLGEYGGREQ